MTACSVNIRNIAVVGTPCQINSIKKMQCLGIIPAHVIKYTIGLFCIGNFSLTESMRRRFEEKLKINLTEAKKLNIKDKMIITLENNEIVSIPLEEIEEFIRPACLYCSDFSNEYADISVGGLGSEDGYTTTLIRSRLGVDMFWDAIEMGYVEEHSYRRSKIDLMKKKMLSRIISFSNKKKQRAEKIKKNFKKYASAQIYKFNKYNPNSLILELKKIL